MSKKSRRVMIALIGTMVCLPALAADQGLQKPVSQRIRDAISRSVRTSGVIRIGSEETFPPIEFREEGKTEVLGVSVDLLTEVGNRLGLKIDYIHADYASLISGIQAGRFDLASGGISDLEEREKVLDFVNYLRSGVSILLLNSNKSKVDTVDDLCGKTITTLLGSHVIVDAVNAASERCAARSQSKIRIDQLPAAPDARMQLDLGRADAYMGDYPALVYLSSRLPGKYRIAGGNYVFASYILSWGFGKDNLGLRNAVQAAAQAMLEDGTYQRILDRWNTGGVGLPEITINVPDSKRK